MALRSDICRVMAGLVPAIHVFSRGNEDMDARHKAGYDEFVERSTI
jgi:hypothetical protein